MAATTLGLRQRRRRRAPQRLATLSAAGVVDLADPAARAAEHAGSKAANLAEAAAAGLPVLPGFAITTTTIEAAVAAGSIGALPDPALAPLRGAWDTLTQAGTFAVVVRSSSPAEDLGSSSMAGRFTSVLAVRGWSAFVRAVDEVAASAALVDIAGGATRRVPMAVLVQPHLDPDVGGVLFGVDPVGGGNRLVAAAVAGGPHQLVGGTVDGTRLVLSRGGRLVEHQGDAVPAMGRVARRRLAALATATRTVFGGPQDIEWAVAGGRLWLLQARPVTAVAAVATGPLLGPGPVAETFPDPLSPLEQDLWLDPLRSGIVRALQAARSVPARRLAASPVVVAVGGRAAADLELLGVVAHRPRSVLRRLDPRPPARRLTAAWSTGRLRAALPALSADLVAQVDRELEAVGPLAERSDRRLLDLLTGSHQLLAALHGMEVLAGALGHDEGGSGAGWALRLLNDARDDGRTDAEIVRRHPEVLALVPPAVRPATLPPPPVAVGCGTGAVPPGAREQLRLRARWVQELTALTAWELGARLAGRRLLEHAADVRWLHLGELRTAVLDDSWPDPVIRSARAEWPESPPLPSAFRLTGAGEVVAEHARGGGGIGAGGGRRIGIAVHDPASAAERPGAVLVTATLDPALAALLPSLAAVVAETGSPLSHLAILGRELGVPVVVAAAGARSLAPEGARVLVDGRTGEVRCLDPELDQA